MKFTRLFNNLSTSIWSPRSIFIVAFLCCIVLAQAAGDLDPRFDKGSQSLARNWESVKGGLPHEKIPDDPEKLKDIGSWGTDYGIGLGKIVGPGFAIAILTLLGSVIYGIFKLLRMCCCHLCKNEDEEESDESEEESNPVMKVWCPTVVYAVCWIFVLTGMIFGLLNNPRFSEGVNDMGDSVIGVGNSAVVLGNGLLSNVTSIVDLIPVTIDGIQAQFSGVDPLSANVTVLSVDINATSLLVGDITTEVSSIDAGDLQSVKNLLTELTAVNNQSTQIITQVSTLTEQIAVQLSSTLNKTLGNLDSKSEEIDETVDGLQDTARGIIDQANDLVKDVIKYVNDGKSYDKSRGKAVLALFVLIIIVSFAIVIGYVLRKKFIFNIIAAFSFVFIFLLWFSGSIHFLLGMALYDACPVIDVTVQGLLPDSQAAVVLKGCLYEHRSVLESMNISAYNLTEVFDYKNDFQDFASFSENFNFTAIDSYFNSIDNLYSYNLTAIANNISVSNYKYQGKSWNESIIYDTLDALNNQTYPTVYDESNYQNADPTAYTYPKNQTVYDLKQSITTLIAVNQTIYNKTDTAKKQLLDTQNDINSLKSNMSALHLRYDGVKESLATLQTKNISNCIAYLDNLQGNITGFFELGNCSFLGDSYVDIRTSLCETMQPSIDCLTVAQFLAGLALIPMAIIAEVMSFRVPKNRISPFAGCGKGGDDDYSNEESGKESSSKPSKRKSGAHGDYAVAMTDSPGAARRHEGGLTATISTAPGAQSTESTPASTPDFNSNRRVIMDHFEHHDD